MFEVEALRPIIFGPYNFSLGPGECLVVSGPSGSGKSLLLRALADLDSCDGRVSLGGQERGMMSGPRWRRKVCYVAAEPGWWGDIADEHFDNPEQTVQRLADIGLSDDVMSREIANLSTGERQRLAILRALESHPQVLLLDEPTSALDQTSTKRIEALLRAELERGCAIVLVTHSKAQAKRFATQTLKLSARKAGSASK